MVKLVDKQTSFNFGILTEKLKGRDDLKQYPAALADCFNFFPTKYGPVQKRVGTMFRYDVGAVGQKVRLVPFVLSMTKSLILEFLDRRVRVYSFSNGKLDPVLTSDGNIYSITTPYTANMLANLSYAQSLNVLYIASPDGTIPPKELRRSADNNWSLVDYEFDDGPYLDQNFSAKRKIRVDSTDAGDNIGLTISGFNLSASDVGRHIRINHPDDNNADRWGWGYITSVTDSKNAKVTMVQKAWDTKSTTEFRLGAWGPKHGEVGWPTLVTIHEQRICWQGTTNYPWLWMSQSFNYNNFAPATFTGDVKDTNAIYYNMATDKIAPVKWIASLGSMLIGTEMYEMRMYAAGAALAPGDCVVRKESTYGAHNALPVITDDTLLFIQRLQRTLRSVSYDYTRDAYIGPELSVLAEALTAEGMKKIVYQREPNALLWVLMEDGTLMAVTYDKEQDVTGWSRHQIAGDDAKVIDMEVVPASTYRQDALILWVERKVNGVRQRYAEMLSREYLSSIPLKDVSFVDCARRWTSSQPTKYIPDMGYLEGETVLVTDSGGISETGIPTRLIEDDPETGAKAGEVILKLQRPIKDGWVGLPYKAYFETLERDFGDKQVSTKMARVRIHRLVLYLIRTIGMKVFQKDRGMITELISFNPLNNTDTPPEPLTGQFEHDIMTAWTNIDMSYSLLFESKEGLPCTVGAIYSGIEINAL